MSSDVLWLGLTAIAAVQPVTAWQYRWERDDAPLASAPESVATEPWDAPGWSPLTLPAHPPRSDEHLAWERTRLPPLDGLRNPALKLDSVIGQFELYVDGVKTLSWPPEGMKAKGMHGQPWFLVDLPPGAQTVSLRLLSYYPLIGVQRTPLVGEHGELVEAMVRRDLADSVVALFMLGLAAVSVLVFSTRRLALTLYCASAGVYTLYYTQLKQLIVPLTPSLWFFAWILTLSGFSVATPAFLTETFSVVPRGWRRLFKLNVAASALFVGGCLAAWAAMEVWGVAAHRFASFFLFGGGTALRGVILITTAVGIVHVVRLARGDGPDRKNARVLLVGFVPIVGALVLKVFASFGLAVTWSNTLVGPSLFLLSLAFAVIAQRSWLEARETAAAMSAEVAHRVREKEEMLRDLHDGIGGVTTNIRLLAELGRRDGAKALEALSAIAELSTEGLAELRAFTQTLDESEAAVTWPVLFSELRRFGGQLIESHGKTFNLTATADAASPPTGALCLTVLRIFREALTNVVKHAGATRVDVTIVVAGGQLQVDVRDDGAGGGAGGGLDTGRGVANMKERARQLGGELSVNTAAGTHLRLELPIARKPPEAPARRDA